MTGLQYDDLQLLFSDEDAAREYLESIRWCDGITCPHCEAKGAYKLTAKEGSKSPVRKGVYKCKACRKQFTVTVGTILEGSHIPLNIWLYAIYLMCSRKEGINVHQLHQVAGITYKSAWLMCQHIRSVLQQFHVMQKLIYLIELDGTYVDSNYYQNYRNIRGQKYSIAAIRLIGNKRLTKKELVR